MTWTRPAHYVLGTLAAVLAIGTVDAPVRTVVIKPIRYDPTAGAGPVPLFNNNEAPSEVEHFGLKSDRGLPLMSNPGAAPGDQWVVGAPPKAYRFTYLTAVGLVYSNVMPTWLPTELYTSGVWYYIEDWRLQIWPAEGGNPSHLEMSNGLLTVECKGLNATEYTCPEDPELKVRLDPSGLEVRVTHPDRSEQVFAREGAGPRYALNRVIKNGANGDSQLIREYIRKPLDPQGIPLANPDPKYRISKILNFGPPGGGGGSSYSVTWVFWKNTNQETTDCKPNPGLTGQCSDQYYCYDRKCENYDRATVSDAPADGDWKLSRIVLPQSTSPSSNTPLTYTFLYEGQSQPTTKYLTTIEDNRGPPGYRPFAPLGVSSGNAIQFGYDRLLNFRGLKSVSYETGRDRVVQKFEFTNYGLIQRIWTDRTDPYHFEYWDLGDGKTSVKMTDGFMIPTTLEFHPIGDIPSGECDASTGCNVQLGVKRLEPPEGGSIENDYYEAGNGDATGELRSTKQVDGTLTTYERTPTGKGRIERETSHCFRRDFAYDNPTFVRTPTRITTFIDEVEVSSETKKICSSDDNECPPYDYGQVKEATFSFANRPTSPLSVKSTYGPNSKSVAMNDGTSLVTIGDVQNRDPIFGVPLAVQVPGAGLQGTSTPDQATNPGTSGPACDPNTGACPGTTTLTTSVDAQATPYWPSDLASRPELSGALAGMGVSAPTGPAQVLLGGNNTAGNTSSRSSSGTDPAFTNTRSTTFDPFSTNATAVREVINGVTVVNETEYAQVDYATPTNGGEAVDTALKNHLRAVTKTRRLVEGVLTQGTWSDYDSIDGDGTNPYQSHLGPLAVGHLRADGGRAPADWRIEEDSRNPPSAVIGCPILRTAAIVIPSPCRSDIDCLCGRCSADPFDFRPGICYFTGAGLPDDFVCRKTYLNDSNLVKQINWPSFTRTHNVSWYNEQCQTPRCLSQERLVCTNPR